MNAAQLLAICGTVIPIVITVILTALRLGRAYGREEASRARYEAAVEELRKTQARHGARLQALERGGRRGGGDAG